MPQDRKRKPATVRDNGLAGTRKQLRQLERELKEALGRQAATAEILRVISNSPKSAQPVFETIVRTGLTLFPNATISIALQVGDEVQVAEIAGPDPADVEAWRRRFPAPVKRDTMHGFVILEGKIVDVPDVAKASDRFSEGARNNFLASGYRAVTMMPISMDDVAVGVLAVLRMTSGHLTSEQFALLQTFTAQANIAIDNTRLVNDMRQTNEVLATVSGQLAKYIPPQLYQSIVAGEQRAAIEARRKKLTVFFSDIVGFTEITDQLEAEELTSLLNEYLSEMSDIAQAHDAYFDKFIGDAMMFYFGDPASKGIREDATACVRMAIEMQRRLAKLQAGWREQGLIDRPFEARIGINTGYCTVGNFGSNDRMDYTIIGGEVNLAARLEENADAGGILLSAETYSLVKDWLAVEEREAITMKGYSKPIRTYAVIGIYEDEAGKGRLIHREDEGFSLTIDRARLSPQAKVGVVGALKSVLSELEE
jgi:class 3 adenylate cyclase